MTNFNKVETIERINEIESHVAISCNGVFKAYYYSTAYVPVLEYKLGKELGVELLINNEKEFSYLSELFLENMSAKNMDQAFKSFQLSH